MKPGLAIVAGLASLISIPCALAADVPFDATHCYVGTATAIYASDEAAVIQFDHKGIYRANGEHKLLDGFSIHCAGTNVTLNKKSAIRGGCKALDPKGEAIHLVFEGAAGDKGTGQMVGGTGAWKGISGGGDWYVHTPSKPLAPGSFQACLRFHGTVKTSQ